MQDWLAHQAEVNPEAPALEAAAGVTTYSQLEAKTRACAGRLAALGVRAGDRIATTLPAGDEFAALLHGVSKLDAVCVPLNTRLTQAERRWQLEDCGARLVVSEPLTGPSDDVAVATDHDPDRPHSILYTSGTTSQPKPVALTYRNYLASAEASASNLGVRQDDRWLCVLPVFHIGGLSILIRSCIYGTTAILHEGFDTERAKSSLESGQATLVSLVSTMLRRLIDAGLESAPSLRAALVGGGPVSDNLLAEARHRQIAVLQTYGLTETCSQVATLSVREAERSPGAAGRPLSGAQIAISGDGEILVRGPMVAQSAIAPDGWLHTQDRGRLDADGLLWVEGRLADTIVTGGENVAAVEVEEALTRHPAVREAAVVGRADPHWGQSVIAYVVCDREVADRELLDHCRARLASFKVPKAILRTEQLPRNASGKLLRRLLAEV